MNNSRRMCWRMWVKDIILIYLSGQGKCGLDVGQNYNLSKEEDAKVPQCSLEKEVAIKGGTETFSNDNVVFEMVRIISPWPSS